MTKKGIVQFWNQMSLKRKLYTIILSMGGIMVIAILANIQIMYSFVGDVKILMDDNLSSYKFQEALGNEIQSFSDLMRDRSVSNDASFQEAVKQTKDVLNQLPFEYSQIGEERYAITWNIKNAYEQYQIKLENLLLMDLKEKNYIAELYKVYDMQNYLKEYTARLMKEVFDGGSTYYEDSILVLRRMPYIVVVSSMVALAIFIFITRVLTRDIIIVLSDLVKVSKSIEKNDFSVVDVAWNGQDEIGQLVYAFNKMKHSTRDYVRTLEEKRAIEEILYLQELEKTNLERKFSEAQLQLVKSQLNPHFLFNTLNMITRMAQIEEAKVTEEMLIALSNLLRYSLRTTSPFAPLNQELKVIRDYMYIQEKRFGKRISWEIEENTKNDMIELPVFLLQPLVENAVIHGISMKEVGGNIKVSIRQEEEQLFICVEDTGLGMSSERLNQIRSAIKKRSTNEKIGLGLGNIYQRITAYYEQGDVLVDSIEGEGTSIQIILGPRI
jgi:Predicted signal transduction protein with a C-terminal ATPase domain